jgi:hypothetical protein
MHTGFSIPLIIHPQYGSVQSTGFSLDSLIIKYGFVESIGFDLSHAPIGYGTTETSGFSIYPLNPVYGAVVQIGFGLPVPDYFFGVKVRGFSFPLQNPEFGLVENFGFEIGTETGYGFGLVENVGFEIGTETGYGFGLVENVGFNSPILNVEFGYKPVGFAVGMVGVGYGKIVSIVTTEWITKVKYAVTGEWLSHISSQIYTASEFTSSINTAITSEWGASIGSAVAVSSEWITPVFSSFNVSSEFNTKVRYPVNTSHQSKIGYKTATASEWGTEIESLPLTQTASEWVAVAQSPIASAWQEFVFNEKATASEWGTEIESLPLTQTASEWVAVAQSPIASAWQEFVFNEKATASEWGTEIESLLLTQTASEWVAVAQSPIASAWQEFVFNEKATASEWGTEIKSLLLTQTASEWVAVAQSPIASAWQEFVFNEKATASEWGTEIKSLLLTQTASEWVAVAQSPIASEWQEFVFNEKATASEWGTEIESLLLTQTASEWVAVAQSPIASEWQEFVFNEKATASEWGTEIESLLLTQTASEWVAVAQSPIASEWQEFVFNEKATASEWGTEIKSLLLTQTASEWVAVAQSPIASEWQEFVFNEKATASEWGTEIESLLLTQTASEWVAVAQSPIASAWQEFVFNEKATASEWGTEIESLLPTASEWGISLFHKDESQVLSEWNTSVIGFQPPIDIILDDNHIIDEKGRRIEISDISVSIDVDSFAWSGQTSLLTYHEYSRLKTGDIIHVYLQGILFVFEVQPKSHEYSSSPEVGLSIRLLSPCARLNREQISGEFFGTAKDICESIAGLSIQWNTLNWVIPRGLLIVNSQSRAEVIKNILSAAGSILQTLPNGELIAQPITPQPLNALTASKSKKLTDVQHILSFSESFPDSLKYYNSCRLSNYRGDELQYEYKMEYIESESVVRAYGEPFDDTIQLSHTSSHPIFIGAGRNVLVNTCQQVEFKEGQGQVNHPIDTINNVVWKTKPLDINGFSGRTVIASIINQHGFGIADIQYTYRAIDFPVSFSNQDKQVAQILLSASDKKSQHHDIEVKRGAGDKPRKEDIISPLSDLPALLLKGRVEIDIGENWPVVSMQIRFDGNISVGQSVAIFDRLLGVERLGVVMSVAHGYTKTFITQISVMLKP